MKKVILVGFVLLIVVTSLLTWARPYPKVTEYEYEGETYYIKYLNNDEFNKFAQKRLDDANNTNPLYPTLLRGLTTEKCKQNNTIYVRDNLLTIFGLEQLILHEIGHIFYNDTVEAEHHDITKLNAMNPIPFLRLSNSI